MNYKDNKIIKKNLKTLKIQLKNNKLYKQILVWSNMKKKFKKKNLNIRIC